MSAKVVPISRKQRLCRGCPQEAEKYDNPIGCTHCEKMGEFKKRETRNRER